MEREWFCVLVDEYVMIVDYLALKDAFRQYRGGNPFEAVRILAAADSAVLALPQEELRKLAKTHPRGIWVTSIGEDSLQILLGEAYYLWIHVVLSGDDAGEEAVEKMGLLPESDAPGFNRRRDILLVNEWTFSIEE